MEDSIKETTVLPEAVKPLDVLFSEWLRDNRATFSVVAVAPKGERLSLENFLPAGWGAMLVLSPVGRKV